MPGVDFQTVREQVSMADVLRLLHFERTSVRGDQRRGPCPVHGSQTKHSRSFSVNLQRGRYRCFVCGSRGNVIELWAAVRKMNLHGAAVELCQSLGLEVPWIKRW